MDLMLLTVSSWIVVGGLFIASATALGKTLERRGAKKLGMLELSSVSEIISEATRIENKALSRMAQYELDSKLSFNCSEMNDASHPLTSEFIVAMQKLSKMKSEINLNSPRSEVKKLLPLAWDFSLKVSQAEAPLLQRMLDSEDVTPLERANYEEQLNLIKSALASTMLNKRSMFSKPVGLSIENKNFENREIDNLQSSVELEDYSLAIGELEWNPSNTSSMTEMFKDWKPRSINK